MQSALVTGAAGFIGSHVCEALLEAGFQVIGLDSFDDFYDPAVKRVNLQGCRGREGFSLVEGDIRDAAAVVSALGDGVDVVLHLAARAGVRPSIENPVLYQDVNVNGTCVVLEASKDRGVERFILASSSSVYGNNRKVPFGESDNVDYPISPYAASKKATELLGYTYHHLFGMNVTCLRFFTVFGARQRPDLAIHKFTRLIEAGRPIPVYGDGSMERDHTYIDDIVAGVMAAVQRCDGFSIYNLGGSQPVSLSDMIAAIEEALGKTAKIERLPLQPGDVKTTYADVSLARKALGYEPRTSLAAGLKEFVAWFRAGGSG